MQLLPSTIPTWTIGKDSPSRICKLLQRQAEAGVKFFCFDYFDTLAVREIQPEYTKQLAARLHSLLLGRRLSPEQLYALRQQLERELCEQNAASGGELEFYLPGFAPIYRLRLREILGNLEPLRHVEQFCESIIAIETAVEMAVQQPCSDTIKVLAWLKQQGLSTVLVSDFYLPRRSFKQMLENLGLLGQFDRMYISADYGIAKSSGRLYWKVCRDLNLNAKQLLMIGDNPHSDVLRAKEKGMPCIHLRNPQQQDYYAKWQPEQMDAPDRVQRLFNEAAAQSGLFKEIGTSLWYFTWKLLLELQQRQIRDVFFFSKEGEFLKKLFDLLHAELFGGLLIRSHYLMVSRKATFLASLNPLSEEDFIRLFYQYRDISPRDFLLSLNIEEREATAICAEAGIDFQTRLPRLSTQPVFRQLLDSPRFRKVYETRRTSQRRNFILYLNSFEAENLEDGITIVDVGWKGTIQDNLRHILSQCVPVQGFYVGHLTAAPQQEGNRKQGLLFDSSCPHLPYFNVYNNNRSLFEMMLGASHGSADGYFTTEEFACLQNDHRREIRQRIPIKPDPLLITALDMPEERALFEAKIRPIQEQVYQEAKRLNRALLRAGCVAPDAEWFARRHARMVFTPTRKEVNFFESLYHLENFGVFEYTDFRTQTKLSLLQRWRNFVKMRQNPAMLEMGIWPPIILRRLGLDFYRHINGKRRHWREFKQK
ncbi:HAD hydrolase-like protein [Candidatus Electronema sp. PJ]|uniref:HAD hydrolase-like protein n=1 Tax=Candidatus Electronema sp. PJ TaxID=3401572 RepID=UPI003AA8D142